MSKCPDCMNEWDEKMCASCGYQPGAPVITPNALPLGMTLANRYTLGNALGVSRQSIAYSAWDHQTNQRVIITEFYPAVIVKRIHGAVTPQRNQAQFQVAMNRYQAFNGQLALPLMQAFFGNNTAYRVYATAEQPQLKMQAEMLLDQPVLFRDEQGRAQMTINALMIDPLPKERPFARAGKPGKKKKQKALVAIFAMLVLLAAGGVFVLPKLINQDVPVQGNLTAELPTAAPTALAAFQNTQPPTKAPSTKVPPTASPLPTAVPATARPTNVPATPVPTATAVPTLEPSINSWYCKVNDQVFRINADGSSEPEMGDVSHVELDPVEILDLAGARSIYGVSRISLRNEDAQTEIDLTESVQNLKLELQPGNYALVLRRNREFSENLNLERETEVSFHSGVGIIEYVAEVEAELTAWFDLFDDAEGWAKLHAKKHDALISDGDWFYVLDGVYYQADHGALSDVADCFYLAGDDDLLAELKIPLYPVNVRAQMLDQNIFDRAILRTEAGEADITEALLNADGSEILYISQGTYQIDIQPKADFAIQNLSLDQALHVGERGEMPMLDETALKTQVFRDAGLWAYQLGENAPQICGVNMDQEKLQAAFGALIAENPEFALYPVSFENAEIAQIPLIFKSARVSRDGVDIALNELLLSTLEVPAENMTPEIPVSENADAELPEGMAIVAIAPTPVPQPTVDDLPALVNIAAIEGLKLTAGQYTFYPAENIAVPFDAQAAMPVALGDQMPGMQKALLNQLAEAGVGYIAHMDKENEGRFIYQYEDVQMLFTAENMTGMKPEAIAEQQKYTVTIDCTLQKLDEAERASMGIVYVGLTEENDANSAELKFASREDLATKEKVSLMDLAQWDGDKLSLKLGAGKYRLYFTKTAAPGEAQQGNAVRFSDEFFINAEHELVLAQRCEHNWRQKVLKEATCQRTGQRQQVCTLCEALGEISTIPLKAHNWEDASCTTPKTCKRCGETRGNELGHDWKDATCTAPETCKRCGETRGNELGHDWKDATCTAPETCKRCGETRGNELGHDWKDATCTTPKTCSRCGSQEGGTGKHSYGDWYEDRPASCEQQQRLAHKCKICNKVETKAGTPKLGHDYDFWGVCKRCGKYFAAYDNSLNNNSSNNNGNSNGNSGSGGESSGSGSGSSSSGGESSGSSDSGSSDGGSSGAGDSGSSGGESSGSSGSGSSGGESSGSGGESSGSGSGSSSSDGGSSGAGDSGNSDGGSSGAGDSGSSGSESSGSSGSGSSGGENSGSGGESSGSGGESTGGEGSSSEE